MADGQIGTLGAIPSDDPEGCFGSDIMAISLDAKEWDEEAGRPLGSNAPVEYPRHWAQIDTAFRLTIKDFFPSGDDLTALAS